MVTGKWFREIGCCAISRSDEHLVPAKIIDEASTEASNWYPFLLLQLKGLQSELYNIGSQQPGPYWEPAEEPAPALSRSSSDFARFEVLRRKAVDARSQTRLQEALYSCRMVEAWQEMEFLQAAGSKELEDLMESETERICRIGEQSIRHLKFLGSSDMLHGCIGDGWPIRGHTDALQLEWGFELRDGLVYATFSTQVSGDLTKAVAALCELQLYGAFNDDFVEATALEEDGAANDSIWQLITHNKVLDVRADNIWQVTLTDALEDPLCAVIVDLSIPEKQDVMELRGTALPPMRETFSRTAFGHSTYFLVPEENGKEGTTSFRLINYSVTRPVAKLGRILEALPRFAQRCTLAVGAERSVSRLKQHMTMKGNTSLDAAMRTSPRAHMYEAIRQHLVQRDQEDDSQSFYSIDQDALDIEEFDCSEILWQRPTSIL
jgi:hypothetical protein